MLYTKANIIGYTTDPKDVAVKIELNCIMLDADLDSFLTIIRSQFNEMNDPLHFKMILEAQDI